MWQTKIVQRIFSGDAQIMWNSAVEHRSLRPAIWICSDMRELRIRTSQTLFPNVTNTINAEELRRKFYEW